MPPCLKYNLGKSTNRMHEKGRLPSRKHTVRLPLEEAMCKTLLAPTSYEVGGSNVTRRYWRCWKQRRGTSN